MSYETIMVENEEGVAVITLNRPEVLNAMNHVLNTELHDAIMAAMAAKTAARIVRVGRAGGDGVDLWADGVTLDPLARAQFTLHHAGSTVPVSLAVHGDHQVSNALCAAAVALETLKIYEERDILAHVKQVSQRLQTGLRERFADRPMIAETDPRKAL